MNAALHAAFNTTAKTWQRLYKIPYSMCGCYGPPEVEEAVSKSSTFKDKLKAKVAGKTQQVHPTRDDFIAQVSIDEREASHPSSLDFHHR